MHFYGVAPGFPRSEVTIIEFVSLRRVFFRLYLDQPTTSSKARGLGNLSQPTTSSDARGLRDGRLSKIS